MSFLDKLRAIANNVSKVYNAGYENGKAEGDGGGSFIDPSWTNFNYLFSHGRATDEVVSKLKFSDTSNGTIFTLMFQDGTMTTSPLIDVSNATTLRSLYASCLKLKTVRPLNSDKCTDFQYTFNSCMELVTIEGVNFSSATNINYTFQACSNLKNLIVNGTIPVSLSMTPCQKLTIDSLKGIITALKDYAGTDNAGKYTLTLHATSKTNLEAEGATAPGGLTWIAFAESKGWNIA